MQLITLISGRALSCCNGLRGPVGFEATWLWVINGSEEAMLGRGSFDLLVSLCEHKFMVQESTF